MQGIAKQARASNETLYNWYGDKQGLFKALVTRNAAEVKTLLEAGLAADRDALSILGLLGPRLLALLLGNRAIALNRAAAADPSGALGRTLSQAGRESILPLLMEVLEAARHKGQLTFDTTETAVGLYLDLLLGDLQIRRVIGRQPPPTAEFFVARSERAMKLLRHVLS
ncbi:transcriptional regulator, TetR family [Roseovarius marisflavi]|uniref:Transcriptional regulator, TetR family n=1 Tax=Roseovarius marisflavi TaxID=1054996 RepID=A0A1M6XDG9_9RHOB|nr:TetR/AcrR family transcriptional regulator [Roseovarius marisflavi]SHL04034.1 transcriptional regulator, TetR family [Roseovarius marisflavi]